MNQWRPQSLIRLKSLGIHWRNGRLLAAEVRDVAGRVKGVRPLGGTVEYGETAHAAVILEFKEELGIDVTTTNQPVFMENIYLHEGAPGHEILAVFDVRFPVGAFDGVDRIPFQEDSGETCFVEWIDLDALDCQGCPDLFPTGLKTHLCRPGQ